MEKHHHFNTLTTVYIHMQHRRVMLGLEASTSSTIIKTPNLFPCFPGCTYIVTLHIQLTFVQVGRHTQTQPRTTQNPRQGKQKPKNQPEKGKETDFYVPEKPSQNCGTYVYISRAMYVHHQNRSGFERGATLLLDQRRQIHVCYVHVHHQPRDVVHGERYAEIIVQEERVDVVLH